MIDFKGCWDNNLPLIDFSSNKSYHSTIQMAHYEAMYGRRCTFLISLFEVGEPAFIGPYLVHSDIDKVQLI